MEFYKTRRLQNKLKGMASTRISNHTLVA
ncbi:hypothetical protein [Clostridium diolis]